MSEITVNIPGTETTVKFPEGTDPDTINRVMGEVYSGLPKPTKGNVAGTLVGDFVGGALGGVGDLGSMVDTGVNWALDKTLGPVTPEQKQKFEAASVPALDKVKDFIAPPTSKQVQDTYFDATGIEEWVPEDGWGKAARAASFGAGGMLTPLGAASRGNQMFQAARTGQAILPQALAPRPGALSLTRDMAVGALSGGTAGGLAHNFPDDPLLPLGGALTVALLPNLVRGGGNLIKPLTQAGREQIAGRVMREAATDAEAATAAGRNYSQPFPGSEVGTGSATGDTGLKALEKNVLAGEEIRARSDNTRQAIENQIQQTKGTGDLSDTAAAVRAQADAADAAAQSAFDGIWGGKYRGAANTEAREGFDDVWNQFKARETAAWTDPAIANATVDAPELGRGLSKYYSNMSEVEKVAFQEAVPPRVRKMFDALENRYGDAWPLSEVQKLRSEVLRVARDKTSDATTQHYLNDLAGTLYRKLTETNAPALTDPAAQVAWENAVRVTREGHELLDKGVLAKILDKDATGADRIAASKTLDRIMATPEEFDRFSKAVGPDIANKLAKDWLLMGMTNNTGKLVKPEQVQAFTAKNLGLINRIPGFSDELKTFNDALTNAASFKGQAGTSPFLNTNIPYQKQLDKIWSSQDKAASSGQLVQALNGDPSAMAGLRAGVADALTQRVADPVGLSAWIKENKPALNRLVVNRDQQNLIDQLENFGQTVGRAGGSRMGNMELYKKLEHGRMIDLLLGNFWGGAVSAGTGAGLGWLAAGPTGAGAGALMGKLIESKLGANLYQLRTEQTMSILQEAMRDPKLAAALMERATPRTSKIVTDRVMELGLIPLRTEQNYGE